MLTLSQYLLQLERTHHSYERSAKQIRLTGFVAFCVRICGVEYGCDYAKCEGWCIDAPDNTRLRKIPIACELGTPEHLRLLKEAAEAAEAGK